MTHIDDTDLDALAAQVHSYPPLSMDEVHALLDRVRSEGPGPARSRLVEHHLGVALDQAMARGDRGIDVMDLYQEGTVATMVAISEYAARAGGAEGLRGYVNRVVGAHLDNAIETERTEEEAEQAFVRDVEAYERAEIRLRHELERTPTSTELAAALQWDEERVAVVAEMLSDARAIYDSEIVTYLDDN